jgi:hypothetical protein
MIGLKEKVGVVPEVDTGKKLMYPSGNTGGIARAVTEPCRSVVESCLAPPLVTW